MFWLRICCQWNIWEKLWSTRAASVTNDVYSHRSRGGTAGGSASHLDSTPPSPWQPAVLRSKTWFGINDALQMCLGLNWKQARQGCSAIKGDVFSWKGGSEEFCLFLTTSGETGTTSVSLWGYSFICNLLLYRITATNFLMGLPRINTFKGSYGIHWLWLFLAARWKTVRTLLDVNLAALLIRACANVAHVLF